MKKLIMKVLERIEDSLNAYRRKLIFKEFGPSTDGGRDWFLLTPEEQRKAFCEAYVETGDTRCLIDYFKLRNPQDNRYFEKAFRQGLVQTVFRRYDEVRYVLIDYWYQILVLEEDKQRHEMMLKKYFGKNAKL